MSLEIARRVHCDSPSSRPPPDEKPDHRSVRYHDAVIGFDRFAVDVSDYGAPTAFPLAVRHPERITAIISQNGNAYEEGLSDGGHPSGPTGKTGRRRTERRPRFPAGAEAFKRDIPQAVVRFLDTGRFALESHAREIAESIRDFLK
jgi:pimeloyl-ACP methyl ester carboxylesterase